MRNYKVFVASLFFIVAQQYVSATWNFHNIPGQGGFNFQGPGSRNFPSVGRFPRQRNFPGLGGNTGQGRLPRHAIFPGWGWDTGNSKFPEQGNSAKGLEEGFYNVACPKVETIVRDTVRTHYNNDPTIAAGILRMFFHDCFVRVSLINKLLNDNSRIESYHSLV